MSPLPQASVYCRNCGEAAPGKFCPACGQDTGRDRASLRAWLRRFASHYLKTFALLCVPGQLTLEYRQGRIARYVLPLRLYLALSFLFFLFFNGQLGSHLMWISDNDDKAVVAESEDTADAPEALRRASAPAPAASVVAPASQAASGVPRLQIRGDVGGSSAELEMSECKAPFLAVCERIQRQVRAYKAYPEGWLAQYRARAVANLPSAIFVLMPLFASLVMLNYRSRRVAYHEHLVFSFHMHSFWFVAMAATILLPAAFSFWVVLGVWAYGVTAMKRVYGGRWWPTLLRASLVSTLYLLLVLIVSVLLLMLVAVF